MSIQPSGANKFGSINEILKSADKQLKILEDKATSKPLEITQEYLKAISDSLNSEVEGWSDLEVTIPDAPPDEKITNILFNRIQNIQKLPAIQSQVGTSIAQEFTYALQQFQSKIKAIMIKQKKRKVTKTEKVDTQ